MEGGPGHHRGESMNIVGIEISKAKFDAALLLGKRVRHIAFLHRSRVRAVAGLTGQASA